MNREPKLFPKLYKLNNGKIYEWQIYITPNDDKMNIHTTYGYKDGSLITKTKTIEKGKVKRSLLEQAELEANSKWVNKKDKELYLETQEELTNINLPLIVRPMLAQTYIIQTANEIAKKKSSKKNNLFPVFVQRKYDGIRCIAHLENDQVIMDTRKGTTINNFTAIKNQIKQFLKRCGFNPYSFYLDGELYTDKIPFEVISGLVRLKNTTEEPQELELMEYHIYDFYNKDNPQQTYEERKNYLNTMFANVDSYMITKLKEVDTERVYNNEEIKEYHSKYIQEGFEGVIIRKPEGIYELDKRSNYLYKYKTFYEEEFEVVGFHQGDAGEKGCIIWDCINAQGKAFAVRPRGTFEMRKELYGKGQEYIGKKLTVIFQEYSQEGIPRFPVGKAIRDE